MASRRLPGRPGRRKRYCDEIPPMPRDGALHKEMMRAVQDSVRTLTGTSQQAVSDDVQTLISTLAASPAHQMAKPRLEAFSDMPREKRREILLAHARGGSSTWIAEKFLSAMQDSPKHGNRLPPINGAMVTSPTLHPGALPSLGSRTGEGGDPRRVLALLRWRRIARRVIAQLRVHRVQYGPDAVHAVRAGLVGWTDAKPNENSLKTKVATRSRSSVLHSLKHLAEIDEKLPHGFRKIRPLRLPVVSTSPTTLCTVRRHMHKMPGRLVVRDVTSGHLVRVTS